MEHIQAKMGVSSPGMHVWLMVAGMSEENNLYRPKLTSLCYPNIRPDFSWTLPKKAEAIPQVVEFGDVTQRRKRGCVRTHR